MDVQLKPTKNMKFKLYISFVSNIHKLCITLSDRNDLKAVFNQTDYYGLTCEHMAVSIISRQTKVKG